MGETHMTKKIARYRTRRGAQRYANALLYHFSGVITSTSVEVGAGFDYVVRVELANGKRALAARCPRIKWGTPPPLGTSS